MTTMDDQPKLDYRYCPECGEYRGHRPGADQCAVCDARDAAMTKSFLHMTGNGHLDEPSGRQEAPAGDRDKETIAHLVAGLERIAALKDAKQYRSSFENSVFDGADKDGFRDIHPRMRQAFAHAAAIARETLDSAPKDVAAEKPTGA